MRPLLAAALLVSLVVLGLRISDRQAGADGTTLTAATAPEASKPTALPTRQVIVAGQQQVALPARTPTQAPPAVIVVRVAKTNGLGVYIRRTPEMDDHVKAFPDGTDLTIVGDDVDAGGTHWRHVVAPDGTSGYVPGQYVTDL